MKLVSSRWRWAFLLVAVMGLAALQLWPSASGKSGSDAPTTPVRSRLPTVVETIVVHPEPWTESVHTTGTVYAENSVELRVETAGRLVEVNLTQGQFVRAGEVLLRLDDRELEAELARAERRRELSDFRGRRLALLAADHVVSELEYDESRGELAVLDAEINLIRAQLSKRVLLAPFDGVIGLRFVSVGALVTPSTTIATLQAIEALVVDFSLPEKYADRVRPGQRVELQIAQGNESVFADVLALEPRVDAITRTLLIRARVGNPPPGMLPGAFARVTWLGGVTADALLVPAVAIVANGTSSLIYVVENEIARQRSVDLGPRLTDRVRIVRGLAPGEEIVVAGVQQMRPGTVVTVAQ